MTEGLTKTEQPQTNNALELAVLNYFPDLKFPNDQNDKEALLNFFLLSF